MENNQNPAQTDGGQAVQPVAEYLPLTIAETDALAMNNVLIESLLGYIRLGVMYEGEYFDQLLNGWETIHTRNMRELVRLTGPLLPQDTPWRVSKSC